MKGREQTNVRPLAVDAASVRAIIVMDDPQTLVTTAEALGQNLVQIGLTTNQIRNIFGTARKIQANWLQPSNSDGEINIQKRRASRRELILLKPKLAYQAQREKAVEPLRDWLVAAINHIPAEAENEEFRRFTRFMEFFEATLAYHTAYGGK